MPHWVRGKSTSRFDPAAEPLSDRHYLGIAKNVDMKSADNTVMLSSKYQVVVPTSIREHLKLKPGARLTWIEFDGAMHLVPMQPMNAYRRIARGLANSDIAEEPDRL